VTRRLVITVDGPAGAGKSSASRALAGRLGYSYVDTGAMYRAVGVLAYELGVPLDDDQALAGLLAALHFELRDGGGMVVDGRDLSQAIRRAEAGELASRVSTRPIVRERLVAIQRGLAAPGGVVMEGRDIGTVVCPDAPLKFYLTATPAERARRRAAELRGRGEDVDESALAADLAARDHRDSTRAVAPLRPACDAEVLDTTDIGLDEVVQRMEASARAHLAR
jgi:cytidylate kinase